MLLDLRLLVPKRMRRASRRPMRMPRKRPMRKKRMSWTTPIPLPCPMMMHLTMKLWFEYILISSVSLICVLVGRGANTNYNT